MSLYNFGRGAVRCLFSVFFRLKINGIENVPSKSEKFIVCSNHKSDLDPPLVGLAMPYQVGFMAKEELFHFKPFGALLKRLGAFPIKRGKSDFGALRSSIHMVENGSHIVIFPEGGRSKGNVMRKGKMGAAMIAVKAKAKILPIGIEGDYKPFAKINVNIGKPIDLEEYFDSKMNSSDLQRITDNILMPELARLSGMELPKLGSNKSLPKAE